VAKSGGTSGYVWAMAGQVTGAPPEPISYRDALVPEQVRNHPWSLVLATMGGRPSTSQRLTHRQYFPMTNTR
jgi:hypothetical protein